MCKARYFGGQMILLSLLPLIMLARASSVGVILFQRRHELLGDVIMRADCAMYQTKIQGQPVRYPA